MIKTVKMRIINKTATMMILLICIGLINTNVYSATLSDDTIDSKPTFWTVGDDQGVYLVLSEMINDQNHFRILNRSISASRFQSTRFYRGTPAVITVFDGELLVFLETGSCQSYDASSSRTRAILPDELRAESCAVDGDKLYVLAKKDNSYHILTRLADSSNYNYLTSDPFIQEGVESIHISVYDSRLYLLAVSAGILHQYRCIDGQIQNMGDNQGLLYKENDSYNILDVQPLIVNKSLRVIATTESEKDLAGSSYHVISPEIINSLMIPKETLLGSKVKDASFATYGQNIAAFCFKEGNILMGLYSGAGKQLDDFDYSTPAKKPEPPVWIAVLLSTEFTGLLLALMFSILFIKRKEAFGPNKALPEFIQLASVWRRALAFIFDITIIIFITEILLSVFVGDKSMEVMENLPMPDVMIERLVQGMLAPEEYDLLVLCIIVLSVVSLCYFVVCEAFIAATPGKKVMNLTVANKNGSKITLQQAVIRNLLRCLDVILPVIPIIMLVITIHRQRIGDLAGSTIVKFNPPKISVRSAKPSGGAGNNFDKYDDD